MSTSITQSSGSLSKRIQKVGWREATLAVICLGFILRVWVYSKGSAFWLDEAMVFLNIQDRSFAGLLQPLDYNQIAPVGWLFLHKTVLTIFGGSEFVMRMPALLFGLSAITICYHAAKNHMAQYGVFLAVALMALLPIGLQYSVTLKPYIGDIFFTAAIVALTLETLHREHPSPILLGGLFLAGAAGIFLSFPIVIILASAGFALALKAFMEREFRTLSALFLLGAGWLIIFFYVYSNFHNQPSDVTSWMREDAWASSMAPIPFSSLSSLIWYPSRLQNVVAFWFTDEGSFFAIALFGLGLSSLHASNRTYLAIFLALPVVLALFVSMLGLYPFSSRLSIYLIPTTIFAMAFGFDHLVRQAKDIQFAPLFFGAVFGLAILWRTFSVMAAPGAPLEKENIHPALEIIAENLESDDTLYVYYGALPAYWVYRDRYDGLRDITTVFGRSGRNSNDCLLLDIAELQSRGRVWALFSSHIWGNDRLKEDDIFLTGTQGVANIVTDYNFSDVRLVLLDFNQTSVNFQKRLEATDISDDATCQRYWSSPIPK